jgi:predicted secreted protein
MAKVNGSTLFVFIGENRIAKTTGYNLSIEMGKLESTSNESGYFADHIQHVATWTLTSESLLIYDGYSYADIYDAFINRQRVWLFIGDEANYTLIGLALIASLAKSGPLEAVPTISVEFTGVGEIYASDAPAERFIIDELFERIIDQDSNFLIYT